MSISLSQKMIWMVSAITLGLGSVVNATPIVATAILNGSQEVPASTSTALGAAVLTVEPTTGEFDFSLQITGIAPGDLADLALGPDISSVHLHNAPAGSNGPPVVDLGGGSSNSNVTVFGNGGLSVNVDGGFFGGLLGDTLAESNANIAALLLDDLYINVHTDDFLAGAIRGQLSVVQQTVPEPRGWMLLSTIGLGLLGLCRRG